MTIYKCWALSSLICFLFFVFCLSYISFNINYHGKCTAFLFQHFLLSSLLSSLLSLLPSFSNFLCYLFFLSIFLCFILRQKTAAKKKYSKVLDLMYQSPTDLKHLPKIIIMTRENHHHSFQSFLVRRRDQTSRRAYYKCLKYT